MKRYLALLLLAGLLTTAIATAAGDLQLRGSVPGAYALRFWPDRVVLTSSTEAAVSVLVRLPAAAKWAVLDERPANFSVVTWDKAARTASADLPAGNHTLVLGWAGSPQRPAEGQKIPVLLDGKPTGSLDCHFDLEKMTAEGNVACPVGTVRVRLAGLKAGLQPVLSVGANTISEWRPREGGVETAGPVATQGPSGLSLVVREYNLLKAPVSAIELTTGQVALEPKRLERMPAAGMFIEAEDFADEGLGQVQVSTKHFDIRGGKCLMSNSGDGHWLQYKFTIEKAGLYDLYMRAATQEPFDLRSVRIDGKTPPGLGLINVPGTGGWGYSASEWAALQLTGVEKAPSLKLEAGEHTLRITGEGSTHLNLDYLVLVPRAE
jgi:hypothetical protein